MADMNRSVRIYLDNSDVKKQLDQISQKTAEYRKRLEELTAAGQQNTQEFKNLERQIKQNENAEAKHRAQLQQTERVLKNLSGASLKELNAVYLRLRRELTNTARGTETYRQRLQQLHTVESQRRAVIEQMNSSMVRQQSLTTRLSEGIRKYTGIAVGAAAAVTGVAAAVKRAAEAAAAMDDNYSDVMKTTGLTREEVLDLNKSFQQMDTRTSREALNQLAATAGKLGINSKADILNFVEAANQINVALGEDLGEDAIKQIGKMVGVFGQCTAELQGKDLKGQMLSVGSAINALGAASSASEGYLVQFAGRLGGVARQAGISMDNILGFASALDQDMQQVEMSATAFSTIIVKMMSDPAKFAKAAKMDVESFTKLVKTDTNAAMIELMRTLKSTGDFDALTPILKEIGLTGSRSTGVITAMANSIDKIVEAQRVANVAMAEGISVTEEYNTKNNNAQAQLEKAKKAFADTAIELGERLSPALAKATDFATALMQSFTKIAPFLKQNAALILALVAQYGAYLIVKNKVLIAKTAENVALKANNLLIATNKALKGAATIVTHSLALAQAKLTGNTTRAAAAQRVLKAAFASTPWGAILVAVTAIAAALYKLATSQTEAQKALKEFNETAASEEAEAKYLFDKLKNLNEGSEEYRNTLEKLKKTYPDIIKFHTDDTGKITDLKKAYDDVIISIRSKIAAQIKEQKTTEILKKDIEEQAKRHTLLRKALSNLSVPKAQQDDVINSIQNAIEEGKNLAELKEILNKAIDVRNIGFGVNVAKAEAQIEQVLLSAQRTKKSLSELEAEFNPFIQKTEAEIAAEKARAEEERKRQEQEEKERQAQALKTAKDAENKKNEELAKEREKAAEAERKRREKEEKAAKDAEKAELKRLKDNFDERIKMIEREAKLEKQASESEYSRTGNEAQMNAEILNINQNAYAKRLAAARDYYDQLKALETQNTDETKAAIAESVDFTTQTIDKFVDEINKVQAERTKHASQFITQSQSERYESELAALQAFYGENYATDERYQISKMALEARYAKETADNTAAVGLFGLMKKHKAELNAVIAKCKAEGKTETETATEITKVKLAQAQEYMAASQEILTYGSNLVKELQETETATVEAEYAKQQGALTEKYNQGLISEEEYNAQKEQLDYEQKSKELEIQKKYADANFGMQAAGILVSLAQGVMTAWATAMQLGPIAGPVAAAVLTAALGVTAGLQIAKANAERQKILATTLEAPQSAGNASTTSAARVAVPQAAEGRYNVIGQDDNRHYNNVPYAGAAVTGMVTRPTLVGEAGTELIVDAKTLNAIRMNEPRILNAINEYRRTPQRAAGSYSTIASASTSSQSSKQTAQFTNSLNTLNALLADLQKNGVKAPIVLSEFERKQQLAAQAKARGTL